MTLIRLGDYNTLKMTRTAERANPHAFGGKETFGIFLDGGDEGEILMPEKYVPHGVQPGDDIRSFVYLDQDERLIATTETPLAKVGDFAYLECTWVNEYGAFLNWGVMKDLFCPFREQKRKMEVGRSYIVYIHIDSESYRIVATAKIDKYLADPTASLSSQSPSNPQAPSTPQAPLTPRAQVSLLVWQKTDLGFKVIINNRYGGLVYEDQIFQPIHTGDRLTGYLQNIRPDGKIDVSLQPTGRRQTRDFASTLLDWLHDNGGHCPLGDKSDPEDIKEMFHVSKKVFKRAIGDLYKHRLITLSDEGITLTAPEPDTDKNRKVSNRTRKK